MAAAILLRLFQKPLRFTDLGAYGPNERTRSQRLKDLEGRGLLTTVSMKMEKRHFVHYTLTDKGKAVLQKVKEMSDY